MHTTRTHTPLVLAALLTLILAACGGGGGGTTGTVSGSASPSASTLSGTVTGFGSVIVDGVRVDDRAVAAGVEQEDGTTRNVELKIGQHVEVEHDGTLVATSIRVRSEVEGPVDSVDLAAKQLTVLNQTVTVNTDPALGPVTVFTQPYTQLSDIKVGDSIEAHGLLKTDIAGKTTIQATRIEKTGTPAFKRIRGHIAELSVPVATFKLGTLLVSYATATIVPANAALANGTEVYVSIPSNAVANNGAVPAQLVRVLDRKTESSGRIANLGGAATKINATAKSFVVNGVTVDASQARFDQSGRSFADLKEGAYVVVKGTFNADGTFKATTVVLRGVPGDLTGEVELHGTILNFVSNASFEVRDITVDASSATITCSKALANNVQVEVEGHLTATGKVTATSVKCEDVAESISIIERKGVVSGVDATARTFTLTNGVDSTKVQWTSTTLFVGLDSTTLSGKTVEVEGTTSNGVLTATKIKLDV